MGDTEKCNTDMIQRLHSSFNTTSSSIPKVPTLIPTQFSSSQPFSDSGGLKRIGVPPTSPYSQIQQRPLSSSSSSQNHHSRSMSQPNSFFSFDSLPPLSPSPFQDNNNTSFTRCNSTSSSSSLPPRKAHRRSNSDIPNGFSSMIPLVPTKVLERSVSGGECVDWSKGNNNPFVKKECEREGGEAMDDLFSAYMNLDNIDALNSSEADDSKNGNESSRASGTKTNGSDTEGETSSVNESEKRESVKRRASGGDIAPTGRHHRSVSVDSCFMEKMSFGDESSLLKPPPSPGTLSRKVSPTNCVDGNSGAAGAAFSIEFKNGEFTAAEMKKIMANDKLAEMAMADPKRVKRYF